MPYKVNEPVGEPRRVIDDERLKRMMANNQPSFFERNRYRLVTLALIAINVLVFAVEVLLSGMRVDVSTRTLVDMGAMYAPLVQSPVDLYRFVTPMFLHMDLMHLGFNMVALFSVGEVLERVLGKGNYLALYFIAGITGNAVSYAADVLLGGGPTVSAGASTSVFGLFVAVALLGLLHRGNRSFFAQYSKSMLAVIGVNVAYTLLVPSISVSGHLGGALGGLIAMFMIPAKNLRVPTPVRIVVAVLWVAALVYLLVSQGVLGV
ncbi:rhomboid family intramembrane serine protease [Eggerthella guodeyinii]|uniref:Rhomboid family intramembrane serine protease n=1 Tax=Eggerthella guodeyinii TaxID=2690837 RepID=A0A6L7IS30_9ACTN|nr:rhomboid family intramembrane serine protease [Eggerthella guodeyinii]QOS69742.1 rhomboid family intramembrane serine protease [Eggerthella guodeyinii]